MAVKYKHSDSIERQYTRDGEREQSGAESLSEGPDATSAESSAVDWQSVSPGQVEGIAPACSAAHLRRHREAAREADEVTASVVEALEKALAATSNKTSEVVA